MADAALSDLKVVEFGQFIAAPYCGKLLADLGAEVVKVENPRGGDPARKIGPFPDDEPHPERSGLFLYQNTNKRSVTIDVETSQGGADFRALLENADILIEDNPPGKLAQLGLDFATLHQLNPRLIVISITPFGQTGHYRDFRATNLIVNHMSGVSFVTPMKVKNAAREPLQLPENQADFVAGMTAAIGTVVAVFARRSTGLGQQVDISALESLVSFARWEISFSTHDYAGTFQTRFANRITEDQTISEDATYGAVGIFPCKDGHVAMGPREQYQWTAFLEMMGSPELAEDPRFADIESRVDNWSEIEPVVSAWLMKHTKEEIFRDAQARRVPVFPCNTMAEVFRSQQYRDRDYFVEVDHPEAGRLTYPGAPYKLSRTPWQVRRPAPRLGEHNQEVISARWSTEGKGHYNSRSGENVDLKDSASAGAGLPLAGIRVADFSWIIAAPYATQWLSVMGAEVIRIESNLHIDINRRSIPFADGLNGENRSGHWNGLNMGKLSCTLNLTDPRAVALAKEIVMKSDVVVENFAFGQMERFGLGYEELRRLKPDLILVSSSGVGRTGPERAYVGYNEQIIGYCGLASLTGYPGGAPTFGGGFWADHLSATALAFSILAALHHRAKTGEGQDIDIAMCEALISELPQGFMDYAMNQRVRGPQGNRDQVMAPHGVYPCRGFDQWVAIAVTSEDEWRCFCRVLGNPSWAGEEKFSSLAGRRQNEAELNAHIAEWTRHQSHYEAMALLQAAGVAAGPVLSIEDVAKDPHLIARGIMVAPDHPETGKRQLVGLPCRLSAQPNLNYAPAATLGQHNEYVFLELLGLGDEQFADLIGEGVIL